MNALHKLTLLAVTAVTAGAIGCATVPPPPELVAAREDYARASNGPAARLDPASLHTAKKALDRAELAFAEDPRDPYVSDAAYIADRKALFADAQARMLAAQREEAAGRERLADIAASASKDLRATRENLNKQREEGLRTKAELDAERQRLEEAKALSAQASQELMSKNMELEKAAADLEAERAARTAAEEASKKALEDLARTAQVKEDERGLVITLSGQVLFGSGKSTLLPAARDALDNVAAALKANPDRDIIVEGHTDSMGSSSFNEDLSQRRAVSVREYLIEQGVPSEMIRARGRGEEEPVETNASAEGRANNRRVEIVLSPLETK
jgi:outer membrane protein OmpA-like peptidoglycan-associated protein